MSTSTTLLQAAAHPAVPADRFARQILAFLVLSDAACSRRLMRNPFGGWRVAMTRKEI